MLSTIYITIFCLLFIWAKGMPKDVFEMQIDMDKIENSNSHSLEIGLDSWSGNTSFLFASYFGDHMVLQGSPRKAIIWGYAPFQDLVTVTLTPGSIIKTTAVRADFTWSVEIGPITPGGPYMIKAQFNDVEISLSDVLFGDIWLCSGQSNMQFTMSQVLNSTAELQDSLNYQNIRVLVVKQNVSDVPLTDFSQGGILLPWSLPSPVSLGQGGENYFSAVCWLYGKYLYQSLQRPLGLIDSSWGGTSLEVWSSPDALTKCGLNQTVANSGDTMLTDAPSKYSVLWNAMIHPMLNMSIYGAIWYQGESNINFNCDKYNCTFPSMIDDWRKKFSAASNTDALFPFGFVQLAANKPDYNQVVGFTDIRWHQTADYGYVPNHRQRNVFMAVAMDLPDFTSPYGTIHPRDKQDVAYRLSLGGLAVGYQVPNISYQGPYPVKVTVSQQEPYNYTQVEIEYSLDLNQKWLDGFEICCSYMSPPLCQPGRSWWLPTSTIQAYERNNVTQTYASECDVDSVVGIRYAWKESPCQFKTCAMYGVVNGLPMPPFTYYDNGFEKKLISAGVYQVIIG